MCKPNIRVANIPPEQIERLIDGVDWYLESHDLLVATEKATGGRSDIEDNAEIAEILSDAQNQHDRAREKMILIAEILGRDASLATNVEVRAGFHRLVYCADRGGGPKRVKELWEDFRVELKLLAEQETVVRKLELLRGLAAHMREPDNDNHSSEETKNGPEDVEKVRPAPKKVDEVDSVTGIRPLTELRVRIYEELTPEPMESSDLREKLLRLGLEFEPDTIRKNCIALKKLGFLGNQRGMGYFAKKNLPQHLIDLLTAAGSGNQ